MGPTLQECSGSGHRIKNLKKNFFFKHGVFSFHFLSILIWSPGSAEHSFHLHPGRREMVHLLFHRGVPSLSLLPSPLPHKNCHSTESGKSYKSLLKAL